MSCGFPGRPSGVVAAISLGSSFVFERPATPPPVIFVIIGVSITPGWIVLIRMLSFIAAHSLAAALANRRTATLVAQYPARPAVPRNPAPDDVMMIEPPPRRMAGTAWALKLCVT